MMHVHMQIMRVTFTRGAARSGSIAVGGAGTGRSAGSSSVQPKLLVRFTRWNLKGTCAPNQFD